MVSTRQGGYQKFLVKWKGHPLSDCTWITDEEFQTLALDLYDQFHAFNSPGSSFSKPGRNDKGYWQHPLKTYKRRGKVIQTLAWHMPKDGDPFWELN